MQLIPAWTALLVAILAAAGARAQPPQVVTITESDIRAAGGEASSPTGPISVDALIAASEAAQLGQGSSVPSGEPTPMAVLDALLTQPPRTSDIAAIRESSPCTSQNPCPPPCMPTAGTAYPLPMPQAARTAPRPARKP